MTFDGDRRRVARLIYHDDQFDSATRRLKLGAFPLDDVLKPERGGWSVVDLSKCTRAKFEALLRGFLKAGDPKRSPHGGSSAQVDCIEQAFDANGGPFKVVEDSLPDNSAHALIKLDRPIPEAELRGLRKKLMYCFSLVVAPEDMFPKE